MNLAELPGNLVTAELVARLSTLPSPDDFPFALSGVERGRFYEDLADSAVLPLATVVPASSAGVEGQQQQASAQRQRQYQVEVVFSLDDYPGRTPDEVVSAIEWIVCAALGGPVRDRALGGLALRLLVAQVEYGWPQKGYSAASITLTVAATYLDRYQ
ncbi:MULTISPECIES: hypothetical protein [unclassified Pseudomonas]|uniref:hypothetical protein n=1 Tax=unclassified Pseudomonas TaxID=196821 RepID=UPI00244A2E2B|nr:MULTISPECIES: hypothetical protein [unclassified Pseudomonas]MDG9925436.1 hypothetical protein [Pseudomonas sp. GD04045]MDH0034123.1 hypothetical protein [Pseudomonas sp. GD04019]